MGPGLGFVHARLRSRPDAELDAALALLHGTDYYDYLVLHNVACIYAELSRNNRGREREYQDLAMKVPRRAVHFWKQDRRAGRSNELKLIEHEAAFPQSMQIRPDFQELSQNR